MSGSFSLNGRECRPGTQNPVTLKSPIDLVTADEGQMQIARALSVTRRTARRLSTLPP